MNIEGLKKRLRAGRFALDEVTPLAAEAAAALEELEAKCNHIMSEHGKRLEEVARLQRELEEARKDVPTQEMIEAGAEVLYGHPKEKAIEWAKRDKFESCECQAEEVFKAMTAAREKQG